MAFSASRLSALGLAAALALSPRLASADQAQIDYREAVMEAIGGHMKALVAIVKGSVPYTDDAAVHARAIEPLSKIAEHVFPPDSQTGKTEALPAIWEQPAKFKEALTTFQTAASDLAKVADDDPKSLAGPVGALGKSCKGCHDDFKKKD